jgi:hypothetical protein
LGARSVGFSFDVIINLVSLWRVRDRPSRELKAIADGHVKDLRARIADMQGRADTLTALSDCCAGDGRPDFPILGDQAVGPSEQDRKAG